MPELTIADAPEWTAWCDGSALPNPGRMGWGAVLVAPDGERHTLSAAGGAMVGCNNEAELRGVMATLRLLRELGARAPTVYCDNSVVVAQLGPAGAPAARPIERLAALFDEARLLLRAFGAARVLWLPAHRNAQADALARAALGLTAPRRIAPPRGKGRRR